MCMWSTTRAQTQPDSRSYIVYLSAAAASSTMSEAACLVTPIPSFGHASSAKVVNKGCPPYSPEVYGTRKESVFIYLQDCHKIYKMGYK